MFFSVVKYENRCIFGILRMWGLVKDRFDFFFKIWNHPDILYKAMVADQSKKSVSSKLGSL